jgi:2-oxoglutarate ferredoxin oxidoreductase subunit beta
MYAAIRNDNITVIFVNNGNFGMTGGQMAPTTLEGQKTTTSPKGRDISLTGSPLNVIELMNTLDVAYIARGSVDGNANIMKTKKYIREAFEAQKNKEGYSFVEVLSPCPTNWNKSPQDSMKHIRETVVKTYELGVYVERRGDNA